ncbi:MAG: signal recognition particle protein, partial [Candidatus Nanopelagicales bacterium]|nr:signal recognition particle protein [Candidatus Nanopelagicales bacterium]
DIRTALLEADVALPAVRQFCADVKQRALGVEVSRALNPAQQVVKIVNDELVVILGGETRRLSFAKKPPTVIMLVGLQGSGKTTFAGKLGRSLASDGHRPMLVAADLQRPNAVDQLRVVAERAGIGIFDPEPGNGVGDPVVVARDSLAAARDRGCDVVIIDTAGRLAIDAEMMSQAREIRDAVTPDNVLFVLDAMIGQDAVVTATSFQEQVGFDGVVLTKLDGDARGGAALSVRQVTGRPVMYASVGEGLDDLELFHPDRMASRILDMGDLLTLIEQAERAFDTEQAERLAGKAARGEDFTLDDFLEQMQAVKKMGSLGKLIGMLPGMADVKQQLAQVDDRDIDRIAAIIQSMTPVERQNPKIIDGSRRARIARGSGVSVSAVNNLLTRFADAQKMMRQMGGPGGRGRGMPGMPGIPGMPGAGRGKKGKQGSPRRKKGRSGNPAKRAAQEVDYANRSTAAAAGEQGGGLMAPESLGELPEEFRNMLGPER